MLKRIFPLVLIFLFSVSVLAATPTVSSSTHPEGEWADAPFIKVNFSYSGATTFAYVVDKEADTVPDVTGETSTFVDSSSSEISLGAKLDGIYWLHVRGKNSSGWSDTKHYEIKVDSDGPTRPENLIVTSLEDGTIQLEWDASEDALSGIKHYNVYRSSLRFVSDGTITREFTIRDAVAKKIGEEITETSYHDEEINEGYRYHYRIQPIDNAGNEGTPSSIASAQAPSFCDFTISINTVLEDGNISISIDSTGEFKKGNVKIIDPVGIETELVESESNVFSIETSYSLVSRPNGDYNITFTSIDPDFDVCSSEKIFVYDSVFPSVKIISPPSTEVLTDLVKFEIEASDSGVNPSGLESVGIYVEKPSGEVLIGEAEKSGSTYVYDWNTIAHENGRFKIIVKAKDHAGNETIDSAVYSFQNTFFVRTEASSAIASAETTRISTINYLAELREQGIDVQSLQNRFLNADSNFNYAKELFEQGYYFELAFEQANSAKLQYASIKNSIAVENYGARTYIYDAEQLDIFLGASGLDSGITNSSKNLIRTLQPSRRLEIIKIINGASTYYKANVLISFSNTQDNNLSLRVLEIIPKQFTNDANNLSSVSGFEIIQSDPIIAFESIDSVQGKTTSIIYSLKQELAKEQADILLSSNVMNFYISPPILVDSTTDLSSVKLSSLLNFTSLISSLPPIEWSTTNLIIAGIAILVVLFILLVIVLLAVFAGYYFFIRKKH
ncbi:MAG: fibronectin type III domain-containing protein [archaeon]|nr:fibronectin type III domain-containing protein [archaeon]